MHFAGKANVQATFDIINWVLGHSKFQLPLSLFLPISFDLTASATLFLPYLMPILQRRLASLSCNLDDSALSAVLSLTSLTYLSLCGTLSSAQVAWELPLLKVLKLTGFREGGGDARVLAVGAMPQLRSLCAAHCTFDIHDLGALSSFTSLQRLALPSCDLQQLPSLAGMEQLEELDISNNKEFHNIQSTLAGVQALAVLTAKHSMRLNKELLEAVAAVPSLTRLGSRADGYTREEMHWLSGLCEIMFDRHGDCMSVARGETQFKSLL